MHGEASVGRWGLLLAADDVTKRTHHHLEDAEEEDDDSNFAVSVLKVANLDVLDGKSHDGQEYRHDLSSSQPNQPDKSQFA